MDVQSYDNLSAETLNEKIDKVDHNAKMIDEIVSKIVKQYCGPLDDLVKQAKDIMDDLNNPPSDEELDSFAMRLPCQLYFTSDAMESLGLKEDISRAAEKEVFNLARSKIEGTVSDKDSAGQLASQYEAITTTVMSRAYKKVKARTEVGLELLSSIKKVITRRISSFEITRGDRL